MRRRPLVLEMRRRPLVLERRKRKRVSSSRAKWLTCIQRTRYERLGTLHSNCDLIDPLFRVTVGIPMPALTAILIAYNEELDLPRALASLAGVADEIILGLPE